ncbi:MAG TPA: pantoate--beta-alanine ligase [Saprospiraceae bacterium]|nr:pantoate--beta-alanine ligase [Saprospiraceae bacterium]
MIIFKRVAGLQEWLKTRKIGGLQTGFVPTMGALHEGHLSLIDRSREECDITVVSIFVNPKQFNDPEDLRKYPRPIDHDLKLLIEKNVEVLFLPDVEDIYPPGSIPLDFDPGILGSVMEGKFRPGHFAGVGEVMYRLLNIIEPDRLYMGQKDFQQVAIVRKLIADYHLNTTLIMCPTLREHGGLAMSSRNSRLSEQGRKDAGIIYQTLSEAQTAFEENVPVNQIIKQAINKLTRKDFTPEYFSIVDGINLADIQIKEDSQFVVACCAVNVEGVRLIDNMIWTEN